MRKLVQEAGQYTGVYQKPRLSVIGLTFLALLAALTAWHFRDAPGDLYKIGADLYACPDRDSLRFVENALRSGDMSAVAESGCPRLSPGTEVRRLRGTPEADVALHWRIQTPDGQALWVQRGWLRNPDGSLIR